MQNKNSFQLISDSRAELMGYAMLGVFICHIIMRLPNHFVLLPDLARLVYTQGFIFLSGFGLYFSFSKNSNLTRYYKRRINRLYIPYLLMSLPFLSTIVIMTGQSLFDLIGYLTTIKFWISGNFYGMWYIAVLLVLYIVFPALMFCMFYKNKFAITRSLIIIALFILTILYINKTYPDYYAIVGQWISKTIMFPIGMLCGYLCKTNSHPRWQYPIIMIPLSIGLFTLAKLKYGFFYQHTRSLLGIFTLSLVFYYTNKSKLFSWINLLFKWLGKYSLELYVLHVLIFKTIDSCIDNASVPEMAVSIIMALIICVPVHNIIDKFINRFCN